MGQNNTRQRFASRRAESFNSLAPRVQAIQIGSPRSKIENVQSWKSMPKSIITDNFQKSRVVTNKAIKPEIITSNPYMLKIPTSITNEKPLISNPLMKPVIKPILKKKDRKTSIEIQLQNNKQIPQQKSALLLPLKSNFLNHIQNSQAPISPKISNSISIADNSRVKKQIPKPYNQQQNMRMNYIITQPITQKHENRNYSVPDVPMIQSITQQPYQLAYFGNKKSSPVPQQYHNQLHIMSSVEQPINKQYYNSKRYKIKKMWSPNI